MENWSIMNVEDSMFFYNIHNDFPVFIMIHEILGRHDQTILLNVSLAF